MNAIFFNEIKVSYSMGKTKRGPSITSSKDAADYLRTIWEDIEYCERFYMLLLSRANRIIGSCLISIGSVSGTVADPKKIMQTALKGNASAIIIAHNHPSGNCKPSNNDTQLTNRLKEAGRFLDLPVLDHVILGTEDDYYSYADEGML